VRPHFLSRTGPARHSEGALQDTFIISFSGAAAQPAEGGENPRRFRGFPRERQRPPAVLRNPLLSAVKIGRPRAAARRPKTCKRL